MAAQDVTVMTCSHCKTNNPAKNKFCRECGGRLSTVETILAAADAATAPVAAASAPPVVDPSAGAAPVSAPLTGVLAAEEKARIETERMQERVARLLTAAFALTEQKKYIEALPIAEEAARLLPASTTAHSLLATLYEHTEQERLAVEAMERVVALNPDSEADKVKLDQLRRGVHVLPQHTAEMPRKTETSSLWLPAFAAICAAATVLGGGMYLLNRQTSDRTAETRTDNTAQSPAVVPYTPSITPAAPAPAEAQAATPAAPQQPGYSYVVTPNQTGREDPFAPTGRSIRPGSAALQASSGGLPRLPSGGQTTPPRPAAGARPSQPRPVAPVTFAPPPAGSGVSEAGTLPVIPASPPRGDQENTVNGFGSGGRIAATPPVGGTTETTTSNGGYIRIQVGAPSGRAASRGNGNTVSPPVEAAPPVGNPLTRARQYQNSGRYDDAIAAYREALATGAVSSGDAHQAIGQCYQRMGNDGAARTAYKEALRSYEAQAQSGRGTAAAQRGIASCNAALEVLGG